ncbi:MAG: 4Fe-4S dicluster domain-containing protein [Chlorobi bacterium]|nr:4Fe-4S dicluster domain-containing protein [Chlorobiota bacterium]
MDRRSFIKTLGATGGTALVGKRLRAENSSGADEPVGVLVDTTRCIGCRTCEEACAEAHGLPVPEDLDEDIEGVVRTTSEKQWTVVNAFTVDDEEIYVKRQCMHCNQPACASACLVKAMYKTEEGPVIWREDRCMGCRYCMISCPFDVPKFEYNSTVPRIQKCTMCWERQQKGEIPACVENCPEEALTFGKRRDLLEIARRRIYNEPDKYVHHIYGEHEAGGTGYLYLASVPFEKLGFKTDVGTTPYPELTKEFLYSVPVVLLLWPAFLLALSNATKREDDHERKIREIINEVGNE